MVGIGREPQSLVTDYPVDESLLENAKASFLDASGIEPAITNPHNTYTAERRQLILAHIDGTLGESKQPEILGGLKAAKHRRYTSAELDHDLARSEHLGFLCEYSDRFEFSGECLRALIAKYKPL